jgi:hypothetical protein
VFATGDIPRKQKVGKKEIVRGIMAYWGDVVEEDQRRHNSIKFKADSMRGLYLNPSKTCPARFINDAKDVPGAEVNVEFQESTDLVGTEPWDWITVRPTRDIKKGEQLFVA